MLYGIPAKYKRKIRAAWKDDDGLWVQLKPGYKFTLTGTTVVSQDTMEEIIEQLANVKKEA